MKKFTELERNLITVILDGRRSDFKKERDFVKVFGRDANIDLVEGRSYFLEDALFGEDAEVPDIIGELLYETEAGNIHYDVMIDALEAAVNEDWANVPSVDEAVSKTFHQEESITSLKDFLEAYKAMHTYAGEEGVYLDHEIDCVANSVLKGIGVNSEDFRETLTEYIIEAQSTDEVMQSLLDKVDWSVGLGDFDFLTQALEATRTLDCRAAEKGLDLMPYIFDVERIVFNAAGFDSLFREMSDNYLDLYYEGKKSLKDTMNDIKKLAESL
ncbi:hypothetical protein ACH95_19760 [Bacillus glycinifermentans]|uniref:hypothetical protein n=1 Tax=Bacillus TaxID=1386 RepID=UPI000652BEA1|nr:hypothetical protein [Bacillus glycinifermentans]KMM54614.1 hypothetical protein ACH95_19760 [Bacillus glycinifermentans]MEC0492969.1 hypothetical protein [Bacillus glycinifermentans]MEC0538982.1 hypothetical protein [Bacillus glycinifermentans]